MEIRKNDVYTVKIEDLSTDGSGIGKVDGYTLFVKDALIGDLAEVKVIKTKKNYGYGRLMRILEPSPDRAEAPCPLARSCGGCQIQHLSYERQLAFKENKVRNLLDRVGKIEDYIMHPIIGMENPYYYRNKAQYPVGVGKDGQIVTGFYAGHSHVIVDSSRCYIQAPVNEQILEIVKKWMTEYHIRPYDENTHQGLVRHILTRVGFKTGEIMVCLIINGKKLPYALELSERLQVIDGMTSISYNINTEKTNVILGDKVVTVWGQDYITDYIGDVKYQISPLSFYQVNPVQTEKLYKAALDFANPGPEDVIWDLYCGIGTISLFMAQKAKQVYGVEIVPQAIEDAKRNAAINGIKNAEFYVGKAEEVLPKTYEEKHIHADIIVVDPPRKGCEESLLACITEMQPKRVVYVSCDPATLARDLKYLEGRGYKVEEVQCVDMFGHSVHVESIVLLSHKSPDSTINIKVEFGEGEGKVPLDAIAERAKKYQPKPKITYKMIQEYVEKKYGFKVHTAYIAEVKRSLGLTMYDAPNAVEKLRQPRKRPPKEKVEAIMEALKYFEVI